MNQEIVTETDPFLPAASTNPRNDQHHSENDLPPQSPLLPTFTTNENNTTINLTLPRFDQLPELERTLMQQLGSMNARVRFVFPIILLFSVKYFYDNFRCFITIIGIGLLYERTKSLLQTQIALKERSELRALLYVLVQSLLLFTFTIKLLPFLDYKQDLLKRLSFSSTIPDSYGHHVLQVVWDCYLTDWMVQMGAISVKATLYMIVHQKDKVINFIKRISHVEWIWKSFVKKEEIYRAEAPDLESQSHHSINIPSGDSNTNGTLTMRRLIHSSQQRQIIDEIITDDDTTENSDSAAEDPHQKIARLRFFSLLDIAIYLYRSLLPMPLWGYYFSSGSTGIQLFCTLYFAVKLMDVAWKTKGAVEAVEAFLGQKLEFGHYSTITEYDPQHTSHDCPICFDAPKRPVTLDCNHIFCEVCICEWLDKEKTCPVCRKEIKSSFTSLFTLKQEVHSSNHIFV